MQLFLPFCETPCPDFPYFYVFNGERSPRPLAAGRIQPVWRGTQYGSQGKEFAGACGFCDDADTARSSHAGVFWTRLAVGQRPHVAHRSSRRQGPRFHDDHFLRVPRGCRGKVSHGYRCGSACADLLVLSRQCWLGRRKHFFAAIFEARRPSSARPGKQDGHNILTTHLRPWPP